MTTMFDEAAARVAGGADARIEAAAMVAAMTDEERRWCLDGDVPFWAGLGDLDTGGYHRRPFPAARVDRLGVPGFAFSDGPRGVVIGPATAFPVSMARGATWDVDLEERIGEAIGREVRAVGADLYGGVCVNVLRHPAWGRAQETYGEDPVHVGELGAALTRGVQRHAMATVKHLACNSMENARFTVDVSVDEVALHEVYLPHFRRVVDEGVACVMSAYNAVNEEWCGQSPAALTDVLRGEWGFEGMVISDWIFGLRDAGPSVAAGLDVEMPYRMIRAHGLDAALAAGECTEADVTRAVTNTVATLLRFAEVLATPSPSLDILACEDHRALAREAASASMVLLRNEPATGSPSGYEAGRPDGRRRAGAADGGDRSEQGVPSPPSARVAEMDPCTDLQEQTGSSRLGRVRAPRPLLPLDPASLRRLGVFGRLADARNLGDGGSSDVWAPTVVTPLAGLRAALPDAEVTYDDGADAATAATMAAEADVAVVVVGYTKADEGEFIGGDGTAHLIELMPGPDDPELAAAYQARVAADPHQYRHPAPDPDGTSLGFAKGGDRTSLRLHEEDEALIAAVAATNPHTVVVMVAGSAVLMDRWDQTVPAIVQAWYSGMEGGYALADLLLGRTEPTGRLPFTVPTDADHLPPFDPDASAVTYDAWHGYWRLARDGHRAAYPFGFGLSYTDLALGSAEAYLDDADVVIRTVVENRGERSGVEVVQAYATITDRPRRLVGFTRVEVAAGEHVEVEVRFGIDRLRRRDPRTHTWTEPDLSASIDIARHAEDPDARPCALPAT